MSTEPGDIKPQLPPASKPTLPPAPKLSLGAKPAFKPDTVASVEEPAAPASLPKAPTLVAPGTPASSATQAAPAASKAPVLGTQAQKTSLASIKAVDDAEAPKWLGALSALALVASLAGAVLLFLELKPTL